MTKRNIWKRCVTLVLRDWNLIIKLILMAAGTIRNLQGLESEHAEQAQAPELPKDSDYGNLNKDNVPGNFRKPKYDQSLFKALLKTFFFEIWTAGILKLMAGKFLKNSHFFDFDLAK